MPGAAAALNALLATLPARGLHSSALAGGAAAEAAVASSTPTYAPEEIEALNEQLTPRQVRSRRYGSVRCQCAEAGGLPWPTLAGGGTASLRSVHVLSRWPTS